MTDYRPTIRGVVGKNMEQGAAMQALAESKPNTADVEARLVEAESVIAESAEVLRVKRLTVEAWKLAFEILTSAPSVVLADHDKAVRQVTLRETADEYERRWGLDGVPEWLRALAEGDTNA